MGEVSGQSVEKHLQRQAVILEKDPPHLRLQCRREARERLLRCQGVLIETLYLIRDLIKIPQHQGIGKHQKPLLKALIDTL